MRAMTEVLRTRMDQVSGRTEGEVASYIPALAKADPEHFAAAFGGARGRVISCGDDGVAFTIQSISKAFVLAAAFERFGRDEVLRFVGVEPSGEPFNAISLEPGTGRPANPMLNAGAIATTSLVAEAMGVGGIVDVMSGFAGRRLEIDEEVYASEAATGDRNRALAHLLRSHGIIADVDSSIRAYFRQCSVRVTVQDLAVMATTLAFGGRNLLTGERVVSERVARDVMSIMASCGMYDYSGEWMLRVGVPAKSGVSGAVMAVAPSQFGLAVYSPRLDRHGNSVRATALVEVLAAELGLHVFEQHEGITEPRVRRTEEDGVVRLRLAGELSFGGVGRVLLLIEEALSEGARVEVDLGRLSRIHPAAAEVLRAEVLLDPERVRLLGPERPAG